MDSLDAEPLSESGASLEDGYSRQQMEIVVRGANVGVWYCPLPFGKLFWDEKVKEHFHLPPSAEITVAVFYNRLHPDDLDRTRRAMEKSIALREPYDVDYRTVSPDGKNLKWIRASGRCFYDVSGKPVRFDGITIDITDRVNAENAHNQIAAQLEQQMRVVETVMSSITDFVYTLDRHGRFVYANKPLLDLWGLKLQDAVGKNFHDLHYPSELAEKLRHQVEQVFETKAPLSDETAYTSPLGVQGYYEYNFNPVFDSDGSVSLVAGCTRDISARWQLLETERIARAHAEHASHLKDEFLATVSHELRTPLNAILGWAQILGSSKCTDEDLEEGLTTIERNARAQAQIINDLLDMSRIISGKVRLNVEPVDLQAIVEASVATVRPAAEAKGIRLRSSVSSLVMPAISGDSNRLQQVMWNLLSNAVKFTPAGGEILAGLEPAGSDVRITVSDTGEGIRPEFLPFIFDRFRQADATITRKHGGLGLGLSIVRQLVELHGGSVSASSGGAGKGTIFTVSLPLRYSASSVNAKHPSSVPATTEPPRTLKDVNVELKGLRVLVVDDETDSRMLVKRVLEERHAVVTTAGSTDEAVLALKRAKFDVLVSDIGMPDEDGYSLVRRVRSLDQANAAIPAIALTAYARVEDRVKALSAGFQMHVTKPVEAVELVTVVAYAAGLGG